jgi:hypothetical protein
MSRSVLAIAIVLSAVSCNSGDPYPRGQADEVLFGPAAMRIHPIFSQQSDWTGDGRLDGIEALIELQDQFGDPTKASGRVVFELYDYRPYNPDPRGERLAFWNGQLASAADQAERWNRTSRTYSFQLAYEPIRPDRTYVLAATFELTGGGRFFDRIILEPRERTLAPEPTTNRASGEPR